MRIVLLAATLLLPFGPLAALNLAVVTEPVDQALEEDIYSRAVAAAVDEMTQQWGQMDDSSLGTRARTDWRNLVVAKSETTADLRTRFDAFNLLCLDAGELVERYKKLRRPFSILEVRPARIDGERIRVHVAMNWFSCEKRKLCYAISDWANVYFRLDSAKHQYVVDKVELGGI